MCQPISMTALTLGLNVARTLGQARDARRQAAETARAAGENAEAARQQAAAEAARRRRLAERERAAFRARLGSAGVTAEGSPVAALAAAAAESELDALGVLREGELRARQSLLARNEALTRRRQVATGTAFALGRSLLSPR